MHETQMLSPVFLHQAMRGHLGPFYLHGLAWIQAQISNNIHHKPWDEITYPFPYFSGVTVEAREWINNFILHFTRHVINYPFWY